MIVLIAAFLISPPPLSLDYCARQLLLRAGFSFFLLSLSIPSSARRCSSALTSTARTLNCEIERERFIVFRFYNCEMREIGEIASVRFCKNGERCVVFHRFFSFFLHSSVGFSWKLQIGFERFVVGVVVKLNGGLHLERESRGED